MRRERIDDDPEVRLTALSFERFDSSGDFLDACLFDLAQKHWLRSPVALAIRTEFGTEVIRFDSFHDYIDDFLEPLLSQALDDPRMRSTVDYDGEPGDADICDCEACQRRRRDDSSRSRSPKPKPPGGASARARVA
jgi:hypothetical protein